MLNAILVGRGLGKGQILTLKCAGKMERWVEHANNFKADWPTRCKELHMGNLISVSRNCNLYIFIQFPEPFEHFPNCLVV